MIRFEFLEKLGVAAAGVSEKSDGDCALQGPDVDAGRRSREQVCAACRIDARDLVCAEQVHGMAIQRARETDRGRGVRSGTPAFPSTDGMVTEVAGLPLAIFVADCVPLFLADPRRGAGGLVHAGRNGILHNIPGAAITRLDRDLQVQPADIHALIGPSAGPCCYEVSPPLAAAFAAAGLPVHGRKLDLWESAILQLVACGVPRSQIRVAGICTICDGRFYSHRREADGCRNLALMAL